MNKEGGDGSATNEEHVEGSVRPDAMRGRPELVSQPAAALRRHLRFGLMACLSIGGCASPTGPWSALDLLEVRQTIQPSVLGPTDTAVVITVVRNPTADNVSFPSRCLGPSYDIYRDRRRVTRFGLGCVVYPERTVKYLPGDSSVSVGSFTLGGFVGGAKFGPLSAGTYEIRAEWEVAGAKRPFGEFVRVDVR
jgi:hypothetical protein